MVVLLHLAWVPAKKIAPCLGVTVTRTPRDFVIGSLSRPGSRLWGDRIKFVWFLSQSLLLTEMPLSSKLSTFLNAIELPPRDRFISPVRFVSVLFFPFSQFLPEAKAYRSSRGNVRGSVRPSVRP